MSGDAVADVMREAARRFVLPRFRPAGSPAPASAQRVHDKGGGDLVTDADLEAEAWLAHTLPDLVSLPVVAEETYGPRARATLAAGACWIVDALDGTRPFVEGDARFAMIVARVQDHRVEAAWLYFPALGRLICAQRGCGAREGSTRLSVCGEDAPGRFRLRHLDPVPRARVEDAVRAAGFVDDGPTCWELLRLATGEPGVYLCTHVLPWDLAAGVLLVEEAGGAVVRHDDAPVRVTDERGLYVFAPNVASAHRWVDAFGLAELAPRSPLVAEGTP
ncbi:MAG: inositol monophosphatase family protein [Myxococcota bacterium]